MTKTFSITAEHGSDPRSPMRYVGVRLHSGLESRSERRRRTERKEIAPLGLRRTIAGRICSILRGGGATGETAVRNRNRRRGTAPASPRPLRGRRLGRTGQRGGAAQRLERMGKIPRSRLPRHQAQDQNSPSQQSTPSGAGGEKAAGKEEGGTEVAPTPDARGSEMKPGIQDRPASDQPQPPAK